MGGGSAAEVGGARFILRIKLLVFPHPFGSRLCPPLSLPWGLAGVGLSWWGLNSELNPQNPEKQQVSNMDSALPKLLDLLGLDPKKAEERVSAWQGSPSLLRGVLPGPDHSLSTWQVLRGSELHL